jgi:predicted dehydrogenase
VTIEVAVIGLGRISGLHIEGYLRLPRSSLRIAAVCDANIDRAVAAARRVGDGCVARPLDDILADDRIDAVEILVPSDRQTGVALAAIEAGKHVTLQKPLAGDLATGERIVAAAERAGVHLRVFENTINSPAWRAAEALIADGEIGQPLSIYLRWANSLRQSGWEVPAESWAWRTTGPWAEQFAAPTLFDDSAHLVSPAVALFGPVERVAALSGRQMLGRRQTGFPYAIAWHHRGGGQAIVEGTLCRDLEVITNGYSADTSITITGTAGICWVNSGEGRVADRPPVEVAAGRRLRTFDVDARWEAAWPLAQRDWCQALAGGGGYRWTGRTALDVLSGSVAIDDAVRRDALTRQNPDRE